MSLRTKKTKAIVYECGGCGASGVKLWREYNTFLNHQTLECCDCAAKSQKKDISRIRADGCVPWSFGKYADGTEAVEWCDSIGWRIPAVPTEDRATFWGYTSVPNEGVAWWKALPLRGSK